MGVEAGTVAFRSAYSSAAFVKESKQEDHAEDVPTSSIADMRVVVEWGPSEKSQLYVTHASLAYGTCLWVLMTTGSHNIWLRDHCRCSDCYHPVTKQRLLDTFDVSSLTSPTDDFGLLTVTIVYFRSHLTSSL